jgi:hypothetical protein
LTLGHKKGIRFQARVIRQRAFFLGESGLMFLQSAIPDRNGLVAQAEERLAEDQ